ncbi:MAG: tetratricopeptide repeat protein [Methylacidiphilales bacterium]|nr:tetratricopeptide repeat protein [Candidatus Methylacidiphilales bacterium]
MPDITSSSALATQTLKLIELAPLDPEPWKKLAEKVRGQNDPLSIKSLDVIIDGLNQIKETKTQAAEKKMPFPQISSLSQSMFVRLSKAYNSPTLLKEAGLIYLRDLGMPSVALQHFERSMRLGGPEKELRPLSEAAAVAAQKQIALQNGQGGGHSGITTAQHAKPVAPTIIRKTGKLLMPSRIGQTAATKVTTTSVGLDSDLIGVIPETMPECLQEADVAIKAGKFKRAEALLKKAEEEPSDKGEMWQAWTNLGQGFYDAGLPLQMEASFVEALKYAPDDLASLFNVALGHHLNDKFDLALESYLKANQVEPKNPKVWCNLGVLYFQTDKYQQSESAFRYATMSQNDYARAWDNLAAALGAQDKLDDALVASQRAVELKPDYPEAYFKMGIIYFTRNEFDKAIIEFSRSAQLPTLTAYSEAFLAMTHARLDQTDAAEAAVVRAAKADLKCELLWMAWNELGLSWYSAHNYPRAVTAYGEATMIKPDESEAWFNLGMSFHQLGDLDAARDAYQQAVDLKQSMAGAWHNLGIVCAQKEDHQAAMTAFRHEVHWAPENVRAWYDLGVTLEKLGREDEAKSAFAKADLLGHAVALESISPEETALPEKN